MNLLTRILAVDVPENTTLHSMEPSFRGLTTVWLIALIFLVVLGVLGVAFFYRLEKGTLGWFRRIILIGLRCSLLLLLLFLIMRPLLLVEFVGERPQGVVLLVDNSQSMTLRDRRVKPADKARVAISLGKLPLQTNLSDKYELPAGTVATNLSRMEIVQNIFKHPELKLLEQLGKFGPLRPYSFGDDLHGLQDDSKNLAEIMSKGLTATEPRTALADSIVKIVQSKDSDPPAAIVVITDGQDNASKYTLLEAAEECRQANVPLHIYGVGSAEGRQLQLKEVGAPDTLFIEDLVSVPLRWRAQGFKEGEVEITVTLGGVKVPFTKDTPQPKLQNGEDLRHVINFLVPKNKDGENQDLVTSIKYKTDGETFEKSMTRTVRVADTKIKILYIEHSPRWEFKFLQPALTNRYKKRCEVDFILVNAAAEVSRKPPYLPEFFKTKKEFFEAKYNLIILGDVASSFFSKEQMEWIKEFVETQRGGLIVMAGRQHMPSTYEGTPIAEMLPIDFKKEKFGLDVEKATPEYQPKLTEAGQRTDWLVLGDLPAENNEIWEKKLLGFYWNYPVTKLKPAATALIVNKDVKIGEPPHQLAMPVLATQQYGNGQVMWLGTDETWRWRWNYEDKYFDRLWGQIIYQFGLPSLLSGSAKRAQMSLEHTKAVVGTQSKIFVRLLEKDFSPRTDPTVDAELETMDAKSGETRKVAVKLNAEAGKPGEYSALIAHQRAGMVELRVRNPDVNTFSFNVELPRGHELEETGRNEKALRDLAKIPGVHFYREEDLHKLAGNIKERKKEFTFRQEILLWNPLAILVFLVLITAEWLVRKFSDLS